MTAFGHIRLPNSRFKEHINGSSNKVTIFRGEDQLDKRRSKVRDARAMTASVRDYLLNCESRLPMPDVPTLSNLSRIDSEEWVSGHLSSNTLYIVGRIYPNGGSRALDHVNRAS